ncbi:MAG: 16S rRNA (guanine(966)-N(2))-methyltransferase RsmD [Anaerolineales bacterium]
MPLRVIAGSAKGRRLRMVPGNQTRPIRDQVKEALFSILGPSLNDSDFLDLFAGTGSVGIEALSRGAARATFVEKHPAALQTIRENLDITRLIDRAQLVQADVFEWINRGSGDTHDFAYVAPPQDFELWSKAVRRLDSNPQKLNLDAWVIAQISPREYRKLELDSLVEFDLRTYGRTQLIFYERPGD